MSSLEHIQKFKIAVLEDSPFYNHLLENQMKDYFENVGAVTGCIFKINSFTGTREFMDSLEEDTDIVLMDFYLENGSTAMNVMNDIRKKCAHCTIIVISAEPGVATLCRDLRDDTVNFIEKIAGTPLKVCRMIEYIYSHRSGMKPVFE